MWFRRVTGSLVGLLVLALGIFVGADELSGTESARWWFSLLAVLPGVLILSVTWITWSVPGAHSHGQRSGGRDR